MRKIFIYTGIALIVAAAAYFGYQKFYSKPAKPVIQTFSTKQNPAFKAVPLKSPLIVEVKDQSGFFKAVKGDNPAFAELKRMKEFESFFSLLGQFHDFLSTHTGVAELLKGKSILVSVNPTGKNQLTNLYLVQLNNQNESSSAATIVANDLGSAYTITRKTYDNSTILEAKSATGKLYIACVNDILMVSEEFILVGEAIRHSNSLNLLNNHEFTEIYKTIEETSLANIFINHATFHQALAGLVTPEIKKMISQISSYSSWTNLDLSVNAKNIMLTGYSLSKDSSDNYLNIFRDQDAQKMTIEKAIPANASFFVSLNLKNSGTFISRYESYLRATDLFYPREMNLVEFKKKTNTDPVKLIRELSGNQFAGVYTSINKSNPTQNRFFVAELINPSDAGKKLKKTISEYSRNSKTLEGNLKVDYAPGAKKSYEIYQLPISNMAESVFGRVFGGIQGEYCTIYDKYLIWTDNLPGMKSYLQSLAASKTMANDSVFQSYIHERVSNPNFYMYGKVPKIFRLKNVFLKAEISDRLSNSEDVIRKFSNFSWTFSVSGKMVKNQIDLKYEPDLKEEPQAVWQLKLEDRLAVRPVFVLNHKDLPNREVIVCDKQNNLSLINKEGLVLWSINVPGEIVSEIHQIDLYQNNKFQYVFNTKTQLYVIDRMGNKVGKFPLTLKSMASNGVLLVDYGKNKEFRFFVAGEDRKIYAYDRWGKLVQNLSFAGSEFPITQPGLHVEAGDKDYLVFSDKQNTYLLDRQGKSRDIQAAPFDHSGNQICFIQNGNPRLISTDISGKIHIQDFSGQAEIKEFGKFGQGHRFVVFDLDGNGSPEYIFADGKKLSVFGMDGKKLLERSFEGVITETPFLCTSAAENPITGIVLGTENKVYLIDKKGSTIKGFPLQGNTRFSFGKFSDSSSWNNLIVGSEGNSLVNYRIE